MASKPINRTRTILVFDHPRSCSNLLGKLLDTHPDIRRLHRPWRDARTRGPDKPGLYITPETVKRFEKLRKQVAGPEKDFGKETIAAANERVLQMIDDCHRDGKVAIVQEHTAVIPTTTLILNTLRNIPYPWIKQVESPTILPSSLLNNSLPILLIRHPALSIPSFCRMHTSVVNMLRPEDEMFQYWASMKWQRIVYEYTSYLAQDPYWSTAEPVVIDAADLVHDTDAIMERMCEIFGIAKGQIMQTWEPENVVKPPDVELEWVETLQNSSGVIRGEGEIIADSEIKADGLLGKWVAEFGAQQAKTLKIIVDREMGDYLFLWERRMRV